MNTDPGVYPASPTPKQRERAALLPILNVTDARAVLPAGASMLMMRADG